MHTIRYLFIMCCARKQCHMLNFCSASYFPAAGACDVTVSLAVSAIRPRMFYRSAKKTKGKSPSR